MAGKSTARTGTPARRTPSHPPGWIPRGSRAAALEAAKDLSLSKGQGVSVYIEDRERFRYEIGEMVLYENMEAIRGLPDWRKKAGSAEIR